MNKVLIPTIIFIFLASAIYFFLSTEQNLQNKITIKDRDFLVSIADTKEEQVLGLSNRTSLAADEGMLFVFSQSLVANFWMKDMKINIDLIWLDGDKIVGWEENLPFPQADVPDDQLTTYFSPRPVDKVLELPAGTIADLDLSIGDKVDLP